MMNDSPDDVDFSMPPSNTIREGEQLQLRSIADHQTSSSAPTTIASINHSDASGGEIPDIEAEDVPEPREEQEANATTPRTEDSRPNTSDPTQTRVAFFLRPTLPPNGAVLLDWRPLTLKAVFLLCNAASCFLIAGGVMALVYSIGDDMQITFTSENGHVLTTYTPTLIATISWLIFRAVCSELFRMLPYFRMADQKGLITKGVKSKHGIGGCYFPFPFVCYSDDSRIKWIFQVILAFGSFLVSFKTVLLGSQRTDTGWIITVHAFPAYYLTGMYVLMGIVYITITIWSYGRSTGLKWDPASPLDLLALVLDTNAMQEISALSFDGQKACVRLAGQAQWRIGYWWQTTEVSGAKPLLVHGIGILTTACNVCVEGRCVHECQTAQYSCEEECICDSGHSDRCSYDRLLYPVNSGPLWVGLTTALWSILLILFVIATAAGGLRSGVSVSGAWMEEQHDLSPGVWSLVSGDYVAASDSTNANIVFRFLPTLMAGFLSGGVINGFVKRLADTQCWSDLAAKPRASDKSLALNYSTMFMFLVPAAALNNGHYRLATAALINSIAPFFAIFVAGLFIFERKNEDTLLLLFYKPAFIAVTIYLPLFALVIGLSWPKRRELLLRQMVSIADYLRPFCESQLLKDPTLRAAARETTQEKFRARVLLAEHLYALGVFEGTCGHLHRGVDVWGKDIYNEKPNRESGNMKLADSLISAQERHRRSSKRNRRRGISRVDHGGETGAVAVPEGPSEENP